MDGLVYLQTKYDKNIKPAWTIKEPFHQKARHVKFTELCKFAQFYIDIEPYVSDYPAVFINKAMLQEGMVGDKDREKEFESYIDIIVKTITDGLNERNESGVSIVHVKFTISDLLIHPIDSSQMAFKIATYHALKEALSEEKLILL